MAGRFLIASALVFVSSLALAETKEKAEPAKTPDFYKVAGSCPKTESKHELKCWNGDQEVPTKFTYFEFNDKPSKNIKTTAESCSSKLIEDALKLPVDKAFVTSLEERPDEIDAVEYKVESCSLFSKSPSTPQLAMIIEIQKQPMKRKNITDDDMVFSKLIFVRVDSNNSPQKILKVLHSRDTVRDDVAALKVEKICDATGDDQAEIILREKQYYRDNYKMIRITPETDDIYPESYMASGGCGC